MTRSEYPRRFAVGIIFGLFLLTQYPGADHFSQTLPVGATGATAGLSEQWVSVGPFGMARPNNDVISGPVYSIAIDPRDANTVYAGAAEGGVWKTSNGGATWRPLTDFKLVRQYFLKRKGTTWIGALAISSTGQRQTLYAGTSNLGVFQSTDGGENWTPTGADPWRSGCKNLVMSQTAVNKIVVTTESSIRVIYAATKVGLFGYREDGTDCWKGPVGGLPQGMDARSMVVDPYRGEVYVAFSNQGIFKSADPLGQRWNKLSGGLPTSPFGNIALAFGGRAPVLQNDPNILAKPQDIFTAPLPIVYAGFEMTGPEADYRFRLFKTVNGGSSWTELPAPPDSGRAGFSFGRGTQLFWNNVVAVGPSSSDDVLVGHIALWRAFDGGAKGGFNDFKDGCPQTANSWFNVSCCLVDQCPNPRRRAVDLHGDNHDIVFAQPGSFSITPSQSQVLYVANDGGVTKGVVDSQGTIMWQQATRGLAIGEVGTIALDPRNPSVTLAGLWHNGNARILFGSTEEAFLGAGDGSQTGVDAGPESAMYVNCNAGFGGNICRSIGNQGGQISPDATTVKFWSDPYRPGHLLRLNRATGIIFRTKSANVSDAGFLQTPDAWEAVNPSSGKKGNTTTLAFRSARLEAPPVYYLGTDTGQVWRGSPEVGWSKLCDCGGSVNGIGPDLINNERIYVVSTGNSFSTDRIKELSRKPDGSWAVTNIAANFAPDLDVSKITSVVVDPLVPASQGTTIYIGTDQGVYRGHRPGSQIGVLEGSPIVSGPTTPDWSWRRSPGVPNLNVTDIEVHQSLSIPFQTGVIRAGTYGRGVFQLNRSPTNTMETSVTAASTKAASATAALEVATLQLEEDGALPALNVKIRVVIAGKRSAQITPFEMTPRKVTKVTLEAPDQVRMGDRTLKFVGWVVGGTRRRVDNRVTVNLSEATKAIAYYEPKVDTLTAGGGRVTVSAEAEQLCYDNLSHRLTFSWDIMGGPSPVYTMSEITYPNKLIQTMGLKPPERSQVFTVNSPEGGQVKIKVIVSGSNGASSSAESTVLLKPCLWVSATLFSW